MPLQIPAGDVSRTREKCVDAGLRFRWIEEEYGLAAFLRHRIVAGDRDLSERLPIRCDSIAEHGVIPGIRKRRRAQRARESNHDQSLQKLFDSPAQHWRHGLQLYPSAPMSAVCRGQHF